METLEIKKEDKNGLFYASIKTNRQQEKHYIFRTDEHRESYIKEEKDKFEYRNKEKIKRAEERKNFKHTLKVGDILNTSWGYEQTNVEFYQVVGLKGKSVLLREVGKSKEYTQSMSGQTKPIQGLFIGDEFKRLVLVGNCVRIDGVRTAWFFKGGSHYFSEYA